MGLRLSLVPFALRQRAQDDLNVFLISRIDSMTKLSMKNGIEYRFGRNLSVVQTEAHMKRNVPSGVASLSRAQTSRLQVDVETVKLNEMHFFLFECLSVIRKK